MKDKDSLNWEVSVGVTFASFMSAVTLFFTGVVISQFSTFGPTIKIPILFLIVSTFSFIFAAAIYSNAGVEITNKKLTRVNRYLIYSNNVFEFLGLHLLVLATPLVIGAITQDNFLRVTTVFVALLSLILYSVSDFSILHKEVRSKLGKVTLVTALSLLSAGLYATQFGTTQNQLFIYNAIGCAVLIFHMILVLVFNSRSKQYESEQF
jgi:hypothetical protein